MSERRAEWQAKWERDRHDLAKMGLAVDRLAESVQDTMGGYSDTFSGMLDVVRQQTEMLWDLSMRLYELESDVIMGDGPLSDGLRRGRARRKWWQ